MKKYGNAFFLLLLALMLFSLSSTAMGKTGDVGTRIGNSELALPEQVPAWWPESLEDFVFFLDETAPRLVDKADVFTPEEEGRILAAIETAADGSGKDFVIYTDVTDYGMGIDVCAADFYDFSGYGRGTEREGICLFLNMDPKARGGWVVCTGSDMMSLYTETVANDMDDVLYFYLKKGEYEGAVTRWLHMGERLCRKGAPFAPNWYPDRGTEDAETSVLAALPVEDEYGALSEAEKDELEAKARELSEKLGVAVAFLYTAPEAFGASGKDYLEKYARYHRFEAEEEQSLLLIGIFPETEQVMVHTETERIPKLSEVNRKRIETKAAAALKKKRFLAAGQQVLWDLAHMEQTGRVTQTASHWRSTFLLSLLAGVFGGMLLLFRAESKTDEGLPKGAENAAGYIAPSSVSIRLLAEHFLSKTRRTRVIHDEDSSSKRGGGSTYSSSYSGHSGSSHSGSGRSF